MNAAIRILAHLGCTAATHQALKADPGRFYLATTFAFHWDGAEYRNCDACSSTLSIAPHCEHCGRPVVASDEHRHAMCGVGT